MKLDWKFTVTVFNRDDGPRDYTGLWPGMTVAEADARAGELVAENNRRRKVRGCVVTATARNADGIAFVSRTVMK